MYLSYSDNSLMKLLISIHIIIFAIMAEPLVDSTEASRVLSTYVAELLKRKMDDIYENSGEDALDHQIEYVNNIIRMVENNEAEGREKLLIDQNGDQLLTILSENDARLLVGKKS